MTDEALKVMQYQKVGTAGLKKLELHDPTWCIKGLFTHFVYNEHDQLTPNIFFFSYPCQLLIMNTCLCIYTINQYVNLLTKLYMTQAVVSWDQINLD